MGVRYKLLFFVLLFHCANHIKAQNKDLYSIKLKSGLVIKCALIRFLPDSTVTIKQYDMVSTIHSRDIISIEHSGYNLTESDTLKYRPVYKPVKPKIAFRNLPENVWTVGIQLALNLCMDDRYGDVLPGTGIKLSALRGLNKSFEAGFCTDLDIYDEYYLFGVIAGQARFYMMQDKYKSPIIYGQLGYGFNTSTSAHTETGGVNFAGGFGLSSRTKTQDIFTVMFGFKSQRYKDYPDVFGMRPQTQVLETFTLRGLEVKVEWRF